MDIKKAYQAIGEVGSQLLMANINPPFSGNISISDKKKLFITTHGSNLGRLHTEEVMSVALSEQSTPPKASVELKVHQGIYNSIPEAGAVIHAHPPSAVALSFQLEEIIPIDLEGRYYLPEIPVIFVTYNEYLELAPHKIPQAMKEHKALIVRGHGSFVWGVDLIEAFRLTVVIEQVCRLIITDTLLDRT